LIAAGGVDIVQPDVGRGAASRWIEGSRTWRTASTCRWRHTRLQLVHLHLACCTPNLKVVEYLGVSEEADRVGTGVPEPRMATGRLSRPTWTGAGVES